MKSIKQWCEEIHEYAKEKGWWDTNRQFPEIVATIHSEISEAFEEYRNLPSSVYCYCKWHEGNDNKPCGVPIELADAVIRIMDYCEHVGIDLEEAIRVKHDYNKTRPYRHGGKQA